MAASNVPSTKGRAATVPPDQVNAPGGHVRAMQLSGARQAAGRIIDDDGMVRAMPVMRRIAPESAPEVREPLWITELLHYPDQHPGFRPILVPATFPEVPVVISAQVIVDDAVRGRIAGRHDERS
jgi:hypothetical protein